MAVAKGFRRNIMRALAVLAATSVLSFAAVGSASAVVITQTKTVSDGFTTCRFVKQTNAGPFGSASQSTRVCRQNVGLGGGGLGVGGFGPRRGIHINIGF